MNKMAPKKKGRDSVENEKKQLKKAMDWVNKDHKEIPDSPFSSKKCIAFFLKYSPNSEFIEPEGMQKFCKDLGVEPENIVMLVLAWYMNAQRMGYFSINEWQKGLEALNCDSMLRLRNKLDFLYSSLTSSTHFKEIFIYAFDFTKDIDQRYLDAQTACDMLKLLLEGKWSHLHYFREFIEQSKYEVINKDQWCNILEFSCCINSDLSNYDEDGAWPILLDEFAEWLKQKKFPLANDGGL